MHQWASEDISPLLYLTITNDLSHFGKLFLTMFYIMMKDTFKNR